MAIKPFDRLRAASNVEWGRPDEAEGGVGRGRGRLRAAIAEFTGPFTKVARQFCNGFESLAALVVGALVSQP